MNKPSSPLTNDQAPQERSSQIQRLILLRVRIAFALVFCFGLAAAFRIFYIQVVQGDKWRSLAVTQREQTTDAMRGNIYAANGDLLATSLPYYRVAVDLTIPDSTVFNRNVDSLAANLSRFFGEKDMPSIAKELRDARKNARKYKLLSKKLVSYQQLKQLKSFPVFNVGMKESGLILEKIEQRFRPYPELARRTVGFVTKDEKNKRFGRGLEYSFDRQLSGTNGKALFQKVAPNLWLPINEDLQIKPIDGLDIETTIDLNLQDTVHRILKAALQKYQATSGCAIVMEVQTGEIKAIVNLGKKGADYEEDNNYAVGESGLAEPGSTFKLMSMAAIMEEIPSVTLQDTVQTGRSGKHKFYDDAEMTDIAAYGKLSLKEVFEKSSNIGMSLLVYKYFRKNPVKFYQHLEKFGLTKPLGFQMVGEAAPYIKNPTQGTWSGSTLPWMSIGYELKLAPIHTLAFYNAIANGGKMMQPFIVKRSFFANKISEEYEPRVLIPQICSPKTITNLQKILEGVVQNGTAQNIKSTHFKIAGKTGTAEKIKNRVYTEEHYTSFVGYFPAESPKFSCIVVIDNPKNPVSTTSNPTNSRLFAAEVAAPVFKKIAEVVYYRSIYTNLASLRPISSIGLPTIRAGQKTDILNICNELGLSAQDQSYSFTQWVRTAPKGDTILIQERVVLPGKVPDVRGMRLRDALFMLENLGLKVQFEGVGRVASQSLPPQSPAKRGAVIKLKLGG
ncbi:MAG: PASTA domain-containing protein [Cytophagales bacterium]|nr:MAG: PASTA domain-containing protein [Cytophagales bacterium]TAF60508.1 MAG: PASTA domain-containing protein [Cytophagales bacterium]